MRLPKIDKEIIEHFFPGKKLKCMAKFDDHNVRFYVSKDKSYAITIGSGEKSIKPLVEMYTRLMVARRDGFNVIITNCDDYVVVLLAETSYFKLKVVHPVVLPKVNNEDNEFEDNEFEDNEFEDNEFEDNEFEDNEFEDNEFEDDYDHNHNDMPYAYTNGRWYPCPYCGSDRITTYMDGTAQCDDCKREFTYMKF